MVSYCHNMVPYCFGMVPYCRGMVSYHFDMVSYCLNMVSYWSNMTRGLCSIALKMVIFRVFFAIGHSLVVRVVLLCLCFEATAIIIKFYLTGKKLYSTTTFPRAIFPPETSR